MSSSPMQSALTATTTRPQKYTIFVRDEEFALRRSQMDFDAPNYFTAIFFGDFAESGQTTIYVDRNPDLFAIIVEYLSGYTIFPLPERALPRTMDSQTALRNLAEDAAFYGLSRLHAQLTMPRQPNIDFAWTGFSGRVVRFEDVLQGNFPESISYTTSGLCSFDGGSVVKPVIIFARNLALKLVGNRDLDKNGRPDLNDTTVSYRLCLSSSTKDQLERQPYSAFEFCDSDPTALIVSVFPDSHLHINDTRLRFEHFAHWWRMRRAPAFIGAGARADEREAEKTFDSAFPSPFEESPARGEWSDRNEFVLWGDELLFIITARGFIAGTLQLHVKLLDVRARTRAAVIETLRPLV
ncbi:hypothetical protein ACEPAG_9787 [Sanghuangporus baumii]